MNNPERLKQWIKAVKLESFNPTQNTVICSSHFREDDYLESSMRKTILKSNAVPSIFNFPERLIKHHSKRRKLTREVPDEVVNVEVGT